MKIREKIQNQREQDLLSVLEYCSEQEKWGRSAVFSVYERMLINQERGSLLSQSNNDTPEAEKRYYQVSEKIEKRIAFTLTKIKNNEEL
ncbi:hypothetical protein [Flavobacterium geliluteum]|uniref:Uncharacterized protein n=1 Tax=Flavobacterium geliluteum TaxID=2816120 RepID=A0A940XA55_9FLAO|nr:hypothetical protein [Flavobacterium geliluteum]MBP4139984.1 hypothetical protein [Flavobacterium geliluteum]